VDYPEASEELDIVLGNADAAAGRGREPSAGMPPVDPGALDAIKAAVRAVRFERDAVSYAVAVVRASRPGAGAVSAPPAVRELSRLIEYGASPRASIALHRAARAAALLAGREYVLPEDVKRAAPAVLRHRIVPSYEAEAERIAPDAIIKGILAAVPLP